METGTGREPWASCHCPLLLWLFLLSWIPLEFRKKLQFVPRKGHGYALEQDLADILCFEGFISLEVRILGAFSAE